MFLFSFTFQCFYSVSVGLKIEKPQKGQPCSAHVLIKPLASCNTTTTNEPDDANDESSTVSSDSKPKRLCLKLDPREHFWRMSPAQTPSQLTCDLSTIVSNEWSCDVELVCDASGIVNAPLFTLCSVESVRKANTADADATSCTPATEVVTPLKEEEVDYLSNGRMVFVEDVENAQDDDVTLVSETTKASSNL